MRAATQALPDYKNLDCSGETTLAAARMEARAREPASGAMFHELVAPLLTVSVQRVLEVGCGTAALSRRVARALPGATIVATDKSSGMLDAAKRLVISDAITNIECMVWDALAPPQSHDMLTARFDLILSSVVVPYFDETETAAFVRRAAGMLTATGVLVFIEQDHETDALHFPNHALFKKIVRKPERVLPATSALGLRATLRQAGLAPLPRRSFLWTDDTYGDYTRDLLGRFAHSASDREYITPAERDEWQHTLESLAKRGDFYYGIVYHLIAASNKTLDKA